MTRDPRYDILFEPVRIGPVTAKNRFYQVPHCNGMGRVYPSSMAEMRRVKAEGGWAVICTEEVEIHPSADHAPWSGGRLWDDRDIPVLARMCEGIHEFGSLAGIELNHAGQMAANRYSREAPMAPSHAPVALPDPVQAREMSKADIRELRRWHRKAALRAKEAGFDLVYVYAGHQLSTISHFLSRRRNHRGDEYGGSLENRARLLREVLEDTKDAVGDRCAVALRFAVDELMGPEGMTRDGEGRDLVEMLADLPDLWDVNVSSWENDSATSRFKPQGFQDDYVAFVKQVTSRPVVGVGRYTSPDAMVSLVKGGKLDFIGAARPSIADPFLPAKIERGELEAIRECIGCNVCYAGDSTSTPIRCTQNPAMGEEWRKGWHPERIAPMGSDGKVLVVGAGPAGLEAARALGQRGYAVTLAEAGRELGGRIPREAGLPGMSAYMRVRDYRVQALTEMPNVEIFRESALTAQDVLAFGADHVAIATGAHWRRDRFDGQAYTAIEAPGTTPEILTPDDVMAGRLPTGPTLVYDEDGYYMGGVIAEKLRAAGLAVTLATPSEVVSEWAGKTTERWTVRSHLMKLGVGLELAQALQRFGGREAVLACEFTGAENAVAAASVVMVTQRLPDDVLYRDILATVAGDGAELPFTLRRIGDCDAPAIVAAAVYAGHRYARELDTEPDIDQPLRHDRVDVGRA